jgi:hypothetical protein
VKFVRNEWHDPLRLCVSSGERVDTCNDCLMDFIGHINGVSCTNALRHNSMCARSTAVQFGIPFGPVLKHGPRSLSSMRVNGYCHEIYLHNKRNCVVGLR